MVGSSGNVGIGSVGIVGCAGVVGAAGVSRRWRAARFASMHTKASKTEKRTLLYEAILGTTGTFNIVAA